MLLAILLVIESLAIAWLLFERDTMRQRIRRLERHSGRPDVMGKTSYRPSPKSSDEELRL